MAATVTLDKIYFETLLRRAEFQASGKDLITPVDIHTVRIPKIEHDNLLRMAQEYSSLKDALINGGINPETLEILIHGGNIPLVPTDGFNDDDDQQETGGVNLFSQPSKSHVTISQPSDFSRGNGPDWRPNDAGNGSQGYTRGKGGSYSRQHSYTQEEDISWDPELDREDGSLAIPRAERKRYAREEQRTILAKNLSERATHKDIIDIIRGGLLLDVYIRSNERSASISFVEGSAAQSFMNYVKKNDIYVHGKRLEFAWNDRQFILPGHVANKIGIGATRNVIIRNVHPNITEERLREDMDHIHNLVIVDISFQHGDVYLQLNSIHNSLFARTCMMSRATYKGMKIEWFPDDCSQPLPTKRAFVKKENLATPVKKESKSRLNRFQMLNIDGDGIEDGSEGDDDPSILSEISPIHINRQSPWKSRTVAA